MQPDIEADDRAEQRRQKELPGALLPAHACPTSRVVTSVPKRTANTLLFPGEAPDLVWTVNAIQPKSTVTHCPRSGRETGFLSAGASLGVCVCRPVQKRSHQLQYVPTVGLLGTHTASDQLHLTRAFTTNHRRPFCHGAISFAP